jgi:hypothetical protein
MVPPPRNAFLAYFLALAPSIAIYKSLNLQAPYHNDGIDMPRIHERDVPRTAPFSMIANPTILQPELAETTSTPASALNASWIIHAPDYSHASFAACLLLMDDNAILPEHLAYHYLRLPLRRLIVAVDPRSETSPRFVLNRYTERGLMNITIWEDDSVFMPSNHQEIRENINKNRIAEGKSIEDPIVALHRDRQSYFISQCFNTLRKEGAKWVIHLDTDEYILPNYVAKPPYKLDPYHVKKKSKFPPSTIYDMIQNQQHIDEHLGSACIALPRVRIGTKESDATEVVAGMPSELQDSINATHLQTFRWRWRNTLQTGLKANGRSKAMVDVSRLSKRSLRRNVMEHNPHRPVETECLVRNMYMDARNSTFLVHHYASTWEQWTARKKDARQTTESNGRTREAWERLLLLSRRKTDHIRSWLQDFVDVYGADLAKELLQGVGELSTAA